MDMISSPNTMDKEMQKRRKALQDRLSKLGKDNPIVKQALKRNEPKKDTYEMLEPVHELVSAAREKLDAGGNFGQCMKDLGKAIIGLGSGSKLPVDKENSKDQNIDIEEDY